MKLRYCSDLHLEFNLPPTRKQLLPKGGDAENEILLVAGDTIPAFCLEPTNTDPRARSLRERFGALLETISAYKKVYFIGGNHDVYYSDLLTGRDIFNAYLREVGISPTKMKMYENEAIELAPRVILLASTLWTDMNRNNPLAHAAVGKGMNDFSMINYGQRTFTTRDAFNIHKRSLQDLSEHYDYYTSDCDKKKPDEKTRIIVMTHHQPSIRSVKGSARHGGAIDYGYFSDLTEWILDRPEISHWIAGHTHHNVSYKIGSCKVLTNCRGYGVPFHKDECFDSFSLKPFVKIKEQAPVKRPGLVAVSNPMTNASAKKSKRRLPADACERH